MSIQLTGVEDVEKKLKSLSGVMQAKLLRKVANKVASISKKRITAQTDPTGKAWAARSPNADERLQRKKMLTGLRRIMRVISVTDTQAVIGFSGRALKIATEQSEGIRDNPNPPRPPSLRRTRSDRAFNASEAATKRQAVTLIKLGFKVKGNKPSVKWIQENMMWQKAGVIINLLRKGQSERKDMFLPARGFLAVTNEDQQILLQLIEDQINQTIR